ncbi:MAG: efflux RND transporter permease subunit [Bacteroidia bacterium]
MLNTLARIVLFLIAAFTAIFAYYASSIEFDYELEKFYPSNDPETEFFNQYREKYASDNDFLLIGIDNEKSIFDTNSIAKFKSFTHDLESLKNVSSVNSVFSLPGGFISDSVSNHTQDSLRIFQFREITQPFIDSTSQKFCIVLLHEEFLSKEKCDTLTSNIYELIENYDFKKVHVMGRSIAQHYYVATSERELKIFIAFGAIILFVVLGITFRTAWGVIVPLSVVLLSMLWTVGLMSWFDQPLNLLLTTLPTIIFIVGISDVIHIISKYLDLLREGYDKNQAIKVAFKEVGLATFLTSITTAIGFLTMLLSDIEPIRHFGLYTAMGVMVAYILAFSFLPAILVISKKPKNKAVEIGGKFWKKTMNRLLYFILKNKKKIVISSFIVAVIAIFGLTKIRVNSFILEDVREDNPLKQGLLFFEDNFSGARPFEMEISVVDASKNVFSSEVISEVAKLENYLQKEYGVSSIISSNTAIKLANFNMDLGVEGSYKIPSSKLKLKQIQNTIKDIPQSKTLFSQDFKQARLTAKAKDLGSQVYSEKNQKLEEFISKNIDQTIIKTQLTGSAHLIDKNIKNIVMSTLYGLVIAFSVIIIIVGIIFKSFRMIIITLIPNILPLLILGAIIGYFGIDIKVSTSIIFTIAFGIAVDDTLHFINKLKIELSKGRPLALAVRTTFISTGKAIILTTLVLCAGFISLVGSSFMGTFFVGLLVSITLFLALIFDLFLLPILILKFYKK